MVAIVESMATDAQCCKSFTDVDLSVRCALCRGSPQQPVLLTCDHQFCLRCLVTAVAKRCTGVALSYADAVIGRSPAVIDIDVPNKLQAPTSVGDKRPASHSAIYDCPICRKPQIVDLENLKVGGQLQKLVGKAETVAVMQPEGVQEQQDDDALSTTSSQDTQDSISIQDLVSYETHENAGQGTDTGSNVSKPQDDGSDQYLLPPQAAEHKGKLTVVLDLDGTLISSFAPHRAPTEGLGTYVVGQGSTLNPGGVAIAERPGLRQFLADLSQFTELVIFTAGLEDYAKPIIRAIDPEGTLFAGCVFREGTTATSCYPCIKDLSRLGRDLSRTVIVDDTPLAFLNQPNNGIPVVGFRGDASDSLLQDAVLPLIKTLAHEPDVRPVLCRQFGMAAWFAAHGYVSAESALQQATYSPAKASSKRLQDTTSMSTEKHSSTLLLCDFEHTITDYGTVMRLVGELAPELAPMLAADYHTSDSVANTNAVLSELQQRGVAPDSLLATLRAMGREIPWASVRMLQSAYDSGMDVRMITSTNNVFVKTMLAGAKCGSCVQQVIAYPAMFQKVLADDKQSISSRRLSKHGMQPCNGGNPAPSSHRLVVSDRHSCGSHAVATHCKFCSAGICKGAQIRRAIDELRYDFIIFCCDGVDDLCGLLELRATDVALVRSDFPLHALLAERCADPHARQPAATVAYWRCHDELLHLFSQCANQSE